MDSHGLGQRLLAIDGRAYGAYKGLSGRYDFGEFALLIDRVQGDPFAAPSDLRVRIAQRVAGFPTVLFRNRSREIALRDFVARRMAEVAGLLSKKCGSGRSGLITSDRPGQEVLERSAVLLDRERIEVRFRVGLPASGRRVLGREARSLLCNDVPEIVHRACLYASLDHEALQRAVEMAEDADRLRERLRAHGLVAFLANGSVLPRRSGSDERPLVEAVVPFRSPPSLEVELECPNRGRVRGMGVPEGITLVTGGGYHGKSTLLRALQSGVYNHFPGDGRELVVTDPSAVKVRAEDGRSVACVAISPFIDNLPHGRSTRRFSTANASGSTSQAANIVEALECGSRLLLIDEDTSATNFMIRDRRMQELIAKDLEPITPFVDRVRQLHTEHVVSCLIVLGGSGDYLEVADTVVAMEHYLPRDVTERAKQIAAAHATNRRPEGTEHFGPLHPRVPLPGGFSPSRGRNAVRLRVSGLSRIDFGEEQIDLSAVEQLVDPAQLRAIARAIAYAGQNLIDGRRSLAELLDLLSDELRRNGLDLLCDRPSGDLAAFRPFELAAAINRLRSLRIA